jgi:hypothetical protein
MDDAGEAAGEERKRDTRVEPRNKGEAALTKTIAKE